MASLATWTVNVQVCLGHQPTAYLPLISVPRPPFFSFYSSRYSSNMSASRLLTRAIVVALVASSIPAHAFYLPGAAPHDYRVAEKVDLFVNALTPMLSGSDDAKLVSTYSVSQFAAISSMDESCRGH